MPKLTKRFVESVKPQATDQLIFDENIPGFGLRVKRKTGVRSYAVQYRNRQGRSRRLTIGKHGKLTADMARKESAAHLRCCARRQGPGDGAPGLHRCADHERLD
jgi:hypothetical protein